MDTMLKDTFNNISVISWRSVLPAINNNNRHIHKVGFLPNLK